MMDIYQLKGMDLMCRKLLGGKMIGVLAVLLVLAMVVGVAEEERADASGQWTYVVEDGGATITGYLEESVDDLVIPSELDGYAVTAIGNEAFQNRYFTSVTIPNSVTHIGKMAFCNASGFSNMTILNSVTSIGEWAFYGCDLTNVSIPASVTYILGNIFELCPLEYIEVAADNPVYEQVGGVLFDKQHGVLIAYPSARKQALYAIPEGVLRIGEYAFSNCNGLEGVIIPGTVVGVDDCAFLKCKSLTDVTISEGTTHIGYLSFAECVSLTSVTFPASVASISYVPFSGCSDELTLSVIEGSYAEQFAEENDIPYTYSKGSDVVPVQSSSLERGREALDAGAYEDALGIFEAALTEHPDVAAYHGGRGEALLYLRRYEETVISLNTAIELDPTIDSYYNIRGVAFHELQKYDEAIVDYTRAIEIDPNNAMYFAIRGKAYRQLKD